MNAEQRMVREFHRAMEVPCPAKHDPDQMHEYRYSLRVDLIMEEAKEFLEACGGGHSHSDAPEMIDALCDILYVTYGAAVEMGIDLEPYFREVHNANMKKRLGAVRADGKRMKPDGWTPPPIAKMYSEKVGW